MNRSFAPCRPFVPNRRAIALVTGLFAGCALPPDPASPPVAWVGADTLDSEELARLLVLAQPFPLETGAAVDLVRHWQLATALVTTDAALPAGRDRDAAIDAFRRSRFPDAYREAGVRARATYDQGELRLIAHVLRRAGAGAVPEERAIQRRAAETLLRDLRAGGAWTVANRRNEDEAAREEGGFIGLVAPGELPAPLDSVAFALGPGELSDVVESSAGFHVLHRPAWAQVRTEYAGRLGERLAGAQEQRMGADAAERRNAELVPIVAMRVGELATDPWGALDATDVVGTFDGGTLTGGDIARALADLPWDRREVLAAAPAATREAFAGRLLVRAVLAAEAADAGFTAEPSDDTPSELARLRDRVPRTPEDPSLGVDRYMGSVAARHVAMGTVRADGWAALLARRDAGFRLDAVSSALERARRLLVASGYAREGA